MTTDEDQVTVSRAAFFDVDNTLVTIITMFDFLEHDLAVSGRPASDYSRLMADLHARKKAGQSREQTNRVFYRTFAGRAESELRERGIAWFGSRLRTGRLFDGSVLARLYSHARHGTKIVLVSGSFPPCLDPIAEHVGADMVLCSRPEVRDGRYTGDLSTPMIGGQKAITARAVVSAHNIALRDCYAYGDHISDVPLMELVGHPMVVGNDPELRAHAATRGWPSVNDIAEPSNSADAAAIKRAIMTKGI